MSYRHHIGPNKAHNLYLNLTALVQEIEQRHVERDSVTMLAAIDRTVYANARAALDAITAEEVAGGAV